MPRVSEKDGKPKQIRDFPAEGVNSVLIVLCGGNDHATLASNFDMNTTIVGGLGNDHLKAGRGHDVIRGGSGSDRLLGGGGNDVLVGDSGRDHVIGDPGDDLLSGNLFAVSDSDESFDFLDELETLEDIRNGWISDDRSNAKSRLIAGLSDDEDRDKLTGNAGDDWLLLLAQDRVAGDRNGKTGK